MSKEYYYGVGRRKTSVARIQLLPGVGQVVVNGKSLAEFFPIERLQQIVLQPLQTTDSLGKFAVMAKVVGGGISGQAGAIRHGIARALLQSDEELRLALRQAGFLTRDSREKERKKYGLKRARKAPQYTKR